MTDLGQIKAMMEQVVSTYGRLDAAFNNAGINCDAAPMVDTEDDEFDNIVNVTGIALMAVSAQSHPSADSAKPLEAPHLGEAKTIALFSVSMVQIVGLTVGSNGRWRPKIRSMTLVWTLDATDAGAGRMFLIEDWSSDGQRKSAFDTVYRTLGQSQRALRRVRTGGGGFWDDVKATPLERYLWVRNAPYSLDDPGNPLRSQEMRPPPSAP